MTHRRPRRLKLKTAREAALEALIRIDRDDAYSNIALSHVLQDSQLSTRDVGLVTELVYGTVQRKNTIDYFLARFVKKRLEKLDGWVLQLLRLSFYQLYYLDRIPSHAVVNEAVMIAKKRGHQGISGMVNGVLRSILREKDRLVLAGNLPLVTKVSLEQSHPEWLVKRWIEQFGEDETIRICAANQEAPATSIRVNMLKNDRNDYVKQLQEKGFTASPSVLSPAGIRVTSSGHMAQQTSFAQGEFTIQDESSMLVAESLDLQPGMSVLDACAAPGGKTTHVAELMQDEGHIWANDLHPHKEALVRQQVERLQLRSVQTSVGDALDLPDRLATESFDRILLDAPCTGFGVIRRKPDIKWQKTAEDVAVIADLQQQLLRTLSPLLKRGGVLVYSTCTLDYEENEQVIEQFIHEHREFALAPFSMQWFSERQALLESTQKRRMRPGMLRIHPHDFGTDGFFIARLHKKHE